MKSCENCEKSSQKKISNESNFDEKSNLFRKSFTGFSTVDSKDIKKRAKRYKLLNLVYHMQKVLMKTMKLYFIQEI